MVKKDSSITGQKPFSPFDADLRALFRKLLLSMPYSRAQFADLLSQKLGEPVTLARLESFAATTKQSARLPAYFLGAITEILDDDEIVLHLLRPCTRKRAQFADHVRELRLIADDLLGRKA